MQATRTYLELTHPGQFRSASGAFPDLVIERVPAPGPELYRHCYRTVGEAYHWRDRWDWSDEEIRAHLASPAISLYVATRNGALAGWYELRHVPEDRSVEIAYFGLAPGAICTLDHPHALPNYRARGFVSYRTETYEVS